MNLPIVRVYLEQNELAMWILYLGIQLLFLPLQCSAFLGTRVYMLVHSCHYNVLHAFEKSNVFAAKMLQEFELCDDSHEHCLAATRLEGMGLHVECSAKASARSEGIESTFKEDTLC